MVAVNDEPLSLVVDGAWFHHPPIDGVVANEELRVQAGVSLGIQLR